MISSVRVGVIGTSWYADMLHLPNLRSHAQAEVIALCGRNRERAEELAAKHGIRQVYTDYRDMLAHAGLQAVVIASPDDQHYAMIMAAVEAGLHVLCEKPLALTVEQAQAMYEKAEATGVKHMTFFTYRWMPQYQYIRALIEQGYLGRPFHCGISYLAGYGRGHEYAWRYDRQRSLGILGDLGSHAIDLARWFYGDIARVSAHLGTFVARPGPEGMPLDPANDAAVLALEFANGAHGTIQVSAVAHVADRLAEQRVVLYGEQGSLESEVSFTDAAIHGAREGEEHLQELALPHRASLEGGDHQPLPKPTFENVNPHVTGDHLFIDCILEDRPIVPSLYDGWRVQQVMAAAIESHRTGRWVAV